MTDDWGIAARDWITVVNADDWAIYLSNGQTISVHRGDFGVEVHHVDPLTGAVQEFDGTPFPYRAGAMEAVRRWIASAGLAMVPSVEQQARAYTDGPGATAQSWDHSYRSKYDGSRVTRTGDKVDEISVNLKFPAGLTEPVDPLLLAAQLNALMGVEPPPPPEPDPLDIAAQLNALLKP